MNEKEIKQTIDDFKLEMEKIAQTRKNVILELKPFFVNLRKIDNESREFRIFFNAIMDFMKRIGEHIDMIRLVTEDWNDYLKDIELGKIPKVETKDIIHMLYVYLGIVESFGNNMANFLVMVLMAKGRDFHIESEHETPRVKHAYSMEELEEERVSLTTKLNFIKENGMREFASIINTPLRNDIAHFKFQIKDNTIYIRDKPALPQTILGCLRIMQGTQVIQDLLKDCFEGWIKND